MADEQTPSTGLDDKILSLWGSNKLALKIVFIVLIPILLLIVFHNIIFDLLIGNAKKIGSDAQKKDADLQAVINKANQEAAVEQQKAADLDKQIADRKESDIPLDWNKKG